MVAKVKEAWGGVHILINNAGVLRDKGFANRSRPISNSSSTSISTDRPMHQGGMGDDAHQAYGRILMTASSTGLFRQFRPGQLRRRQAGSRRADQDALPRGAKYNIKVNHDRPTAGTRMTEDLFPAEAFKAFAPEKVAPAALYLVTRTRRPMRSSAPAPACSRRRTSR